MLGLLYCSFNYHYMLLRGILQVSGSTGGGLEASQVAKCRLRPWRPAACQLPFLTFSPKKLNLEEICLL